MSDATIVPQSNAVADMTRSEAEPQGGRPLGSGRQLPPPPPPTNCWPEAPWGGGGHGKGGSRRGDRGGGV